MCVTLRYSSENKTNTRWPRAERSFSSLRKSQRTRFSFNDQDYVVQSKRSHSRNVAQQRKSYLVIRLICIYVSHVIIYSYLKCECELTREHIAETLYYVEPWNRKQNCLAWFTVVFDVSTSYRISRLIAYSRFFWKLGPVWRQWNITYSLFNVNSTI